MSGPSPKRLSHASYTIAWICALPLEKAVAEAMLDSTHPRLSQSWRDENSYTLGEIAGQNIVIACLPSGEYGLVSATVVVTQLLSTFASIRFGLMVGVGGGAPSGRNDIRLGDIVVSQPTDTRGGVIQYDHGKILSGGFKLTGSLNRPPQVLLTAISSLRSQFLREGGSRVPHLISRMIAKNPAMAAKCTYPGQEEDLLFESAYNHIGSNATCVACRKDKLVVRSPRKNNDPMIHYGLIASSSQVMKDAKIRDQLSEDLDIYCFEMEAAGLMNTFPCITIRGICDYADSHKNKQWQEYAAAAAAGYAKWLLSVVPKDKILETQTAFQATSHSAGVVSYPVFGIKYSNSPPIHGNPEPAAPKITSAKSGSRSLEQKIPQIPSQPSSAATAARILDEDQLDQFFTPERSFYNKNDLELIANALKATISLSKYSKVPRLYTIMRYVEVKVLADRWKALDDLLEEGISDRSLPIAETSQLPETISPGLGTRFIAAQYLVFQDSIKKIIRGEHMSFMKPPGKDLIVSERVITVLGARTYKGRVDEVTCAGLGNRRYARKQFFRRVMISQGKGDSAESFIKEMEAMKRVGHHHCVEFIASYTDITVFALIMLPVAEYNLRQYLETKCIGDLINQSGFLLSFCGCLVRTIWFMHTRQIRHRDIKPENILVHNNTVVVTDFDCCHDWSETNHSTTAMPPPRTWKYASPEVARVGPHGITRVKSSSDIWSLGCVLLEIITVLKGIPLEELETNFGINEYHEGRTQVESLIDHLRRREPKEVADEVLNWVEEMLLEDQGKRPTAQALAKRTIDSPTLCCELCLAGDDRRVVAPVPRIPAQYSYRRTFDSAGSASISDSNGEAGIGVSGIWQKGGLYALNTQQVTETTPTNGDVYVSPVDDRSPAFSNAFSTVSPISGTPVSSPFSQTKQSYSSESIFFSETVPNSFSWEDYLAEVCAEMKRTEESLGEIERNAIKASFAVYNKTMVKNGYVGAVDRMD
ncbi:hypothetical protein TWF481_000073 [Arthrobotrys musiformis]|uniref:Protein kinase domain-containing protein n=1 Tax=Arthrobotrys musiformis TaxID=47236 RepID=A0AAV9WLQ5_9PEZI